MTKYLTKACSPVIDISLKQRGINVFVNLWKISSELTLIDKNRHYPKSPKTKILMQKSP